jgi:ornithine carbamoyltransferase
VDKELDTAALKTGKYHEIGSGHPTLAGVRKLIREVDVVYTDTWVDMEFISDKAYTGQKDERIKKMLPFQINAELLQGSKAVVMHDMPIHAGSEISRDTVETHLKTILQQADNRKYAAQSILFNLLK